MGTSDLYHNGLYLNIGIIIILIDICTAFFTEPYHGIMRRGYFVEFKNVIEACVYRECACDRISLYEQTGKHDLASCDQLIHSNGSGSALCGANRMEEIFAETWQYALFKNKYNSLFQQVMK